MNIFFKVCNYVFSCIKKRTLSLLSFFPGSSQFPWGHRAFPVQLPSFISKAWLPYIDMMSFRTRQTLSTASATHSVECVLLKRLKSVLVELAITRELPTFFAVFSHQDYCRQGVQQAATSVLI